MSKKNVDTHHKIKSVLNQYALHFEMHNNDLFMKSMDITQCVIDVHKIQLKCNALIPRVAIVQFVSPLFSIRKIIKSTIVGCILVVYSR